MFRFRITRILAALVVAILIGSGLFAISAEFGFAAALGTYLALDTLARVPLLQHRLGAVTQITNLWVPEIWIPGMAERVVTRPSLLNSGIVVRNEVLDAIAAGGGVQGEMPFLKEPDFDDVIQIEDTAPTINNIASGKQVCPILNRVSPIGSTALAGAVSASDPVSFALGAIADLRLRQRQRTLVSVLRGFFGTAAAGLSADHFVEIVGNQEIDLHFINSSRCLSALALLGERKELMIRGAMACHSVIEAALNDQDQIDYIRDSEGRIILRTYKGIPLFISDTLSRAGTTSGTVYETYFFLPGAVGMGDKPQTANVGDVASLVMDGDPAKNNVVVYDRTRFILQPAGARWKGTPGGQSATNAELATVGNWELAYGDVKNVGVVRLRTNG